jgi:uncharacterized protein (DUF1697 family)
MTCYIAFLRAINVGGHVVKMETLRKCFEDLGFTAVDTFIASGNVIFETAPQDIRLLENRIAAHLHTSLGYEVATFVRTGPELAKIACYQPYSTELLHSGTLYVGFLAQPLDLPAQEKLMAFCSPVDDFHTYMKEIYWLCRVRSTDSEFSLAKLEKRLGIQATFRNMNTVQKIVARLEK